MTYTADRLPDDIGAGGRIPLPQHQLESGDRFPNFSLTDQWGHHRWFLERVKGNPLLVVIDPDEAIMAVLAARHAAGAEVLAVTDESGTPRPDRPFPILADSAGKVRQSLRSMAGKSGAGCFAVQLDGNQRVIAVHDADDIAGLADTRPSPAISMRISAIAPVLIIPDVLSPETCRALIARWEQEGNEEGRVHSIVDGVEVQRVHDDMKRRRDHRVSDEALLKPLTQIIGRRIAPELDKAFTFANFRFDRFIITCYDSDRGDFFKRHRDNQSPATADRRFALTLNLNTHEYDGGELIFPEYGTQRYAPPAGGAILFSCSLLHEALPVTRGRRFTLLSFLRQ
jgi:predicted 2-oxoglutarate/Fe(II)-dependent dioxygenase YbiX